MSTFHTFPGLAPSFCHPNQNFFAFFLIILKLQVAPAQFPALIPSLETEETPQCTLKCFGVVAIKFRRSQITFPLLPLLIHSTHLVCFLVLVSRDLFRLSANTSLNLRNSSSWGILKGSFNSLRCRYMLFWKFEIPSGSFSLSFCLWTSLNSFEELAKELVESSSRYVHDIKISTDLLFAKRLNFFSSYFTVFDNLSAAMKLSSSWLELSSSCLSFCKNFKKPTRKFGLCVSVFCSFSSFAYFSFKYVSNFYSWVILHGD